jgi:hypothetical protein
LKLLSTFQRTLSAEHQDEQPTEGIEEAGHVAPSAFSQRDIMKISCTVTVGKWKLALAVLVCLTAVVSQATTQSINSSNFEWFGYPDDSTPTLANTNLESARGLIVLLNDVVQNPGVIFAFSAEVQMAGVRFTFQVYRHLNDSAYLLLFNLPVTTSVSKQREDFYIESFMSAFPCIEVRPGDRLGLHFTTDLPPITYGQNSGGQPSDLIPRVEVKEPYAAGPPSVGSIVTMLSVKFPWTFIATGYVDINVNNASSSSSSSSTSSITYTNCTKGLTLRPVLATQATSTTTYLPPTGLPGVIGERGITGEIGLPGSTGSAGIQGVKGQAGPGQQGYTGAVGQPGPIFPGENGTVGQSGISGETGYTGFTGSMGAIGATGPMGLAGSDMFMPRPTPNTGKQVSAEYWQTDMCIEGMYIWLAIASFVVLLCLILLLADCVIASLCCDHC